MHIHFLLGELVGATQNSRVHRTQLVIQWGRDVDGVDVGGRERGSEPRGSFAVDIPIRRDNPISPMLSTQ